MIIGVTGGSGFVGRMLLAKLVERGHDCRALENKSAVPAHPHITPVKGSLSNKESLRAFIAPCDVIIHCGGVVAAKSKQTFHTVNTGGTANMLDALHDLSDAPDAKDDTKDSIKTDTKKNTKAGARNKRVLFISSLAARQPHLSPYADSKKQAEALFAHDAPYGWDILRPPGIYGPTDANTEPLFDLLDHGLSLKLGPKTARFSMIYIDDLTEAMIAWIAAGKTTQDVYEISDGTDNGYSWAEFSRICCALPSDRKVREIRFPKWFLRFIALNAAFYSLFRADPAFFTLDKIRELSHPDWTADETAFARRFDWTPQIQAEQGLRLTQQWYTQKKHAQ